MWNPPNPKQYNQQVWLIVKEIPEGHVMSYKQIATMIPAPTGVDGEQYRRLGARWVGGAMRAVNDKTIPWWRVINSKGEISLPPGSTGANDQRRRLESEGIAFNADGQVDMEANSWRDFDEAWLSANNFTQPD
jgi:methylated-DNA-protein-cysteine methyltransferase-like protein